LLLLSAKILSEKKQEAFGKEIRIEYTNKENTYKLVHNGIIYPLEKEEEHLVWEIPSHITGNSLKLKVQAFAPTKKYLYTTNELEIFDLDMEELAKTVLFGGGYGLSDIEDFDTDYPIFHDMIADNPPVIVNNRTVMMQGSSSVAIVRDNISQLLMFEFNRFYNNIDLSTKACAIKYINANRMGGKAVPVNLKVSADKITLGWLLDHHVAEKAGAVTFQFEFIGYSDDTCMYVWQTAPAVLSIGTGLTVDDAEVCERYPSVIEDILIKLKILESLLDGEEIDANIITRIAEIESKLDSNDSDHEAFFEELEALKQRISDLEERESSEHECVGIEELERRVEIIEEILENLDLIDPTPPDFWGDF